MANAARVALGALVALALLVAAVMSVLAAVNTMKLIGQQGGGQQGGGQGPSCGTVPDGAIVPGKTYVITVPAAGTAPSVQPCDPNNAGICTTWNFTRFIALNKTAYDDPFAAVRFVRAVDKSSQAPPAQGPIQFGERVYVYFAHQAMWFTGKGAKMISPDVADALAVPINCAAGYSQSGQTYACPASAAQYASTGALVYFDLKENFGSLPTHQALTGSMFPAAIVERV